MSSLKASKSPYYRIGTEPTCGELPRKTLTIGWNSPLGCHRSPASVSSKTDHSACIIVRAVEIERETARIIKFGLEISTSLSMALAGGFECKYITSQTKGNFRHISKRLARH